MEVWIDSLLSIQTSMHDGETPPGTVDCMGGVVVISAMLVAGVMHALL